MCAASSPLAAPQASKLVKQASLSKQAPHALGSLHERGVHAEAAL